MKQKILICISFFLLIMGISCHRETNNTLLQQKGKSQTCVLQLLQQIDSLNNVSEYDPLISQEYIFKVEEFCNTYPEDPMAAEFLFKAGLLAMAVAKNSDNSEETILYSQKALIIFDNILNVYPEFNRVKNCILNKGVVYADILHDYENAEFYYREFIAKYSADTLAMNVESYLQYLGQSPDEIIALYGEEW
ncbi:MAG: hypothetical protein FWH59_00230 [Lentimicrobiaceae bacterium]|nr:hypothetical protein [Lentimicrobiaceae bacterium]